MRAMLSMATLKTISAAPKLVDAKKDNLKKAFDDLQVHSSLLSSFPFTWSDIDSHFSSIHNSLTQRFHLLVSLESQQATPQSISAPDPPQTNSPIDPSSSSQPQTRNPKGPSTSSAKLHCPNPKDANLTSLPNDPSSSSKTLSQNGQGVSKNNAMTGSELLRYELCVLCEEMNGNGLRKYVGEHLEDKVALQAELKRALQCAPDPAAMILDSLEGLLGAGTLRKGELRKMKKSCSILFQQLRVACPKKTAQVREKARNLAAEWKKRLMNDNTNALGALVFLHFVAACGLLSKLTMNELVNLSAMAAANDELCELYQIIGLTDKVPGLVKKLIDKGKHILVVKYVFEFNLADQIPPVPILKDYVNESQKLARRLALEGKTVTEVTNREIHALKQVIKVIESHNLESEYPLASLEQRIEQLKNHKENMKHSAPASGVKPPQNKKTSATKWDQASSSICLSWSCRCPADRWCQFNHTPVPTTSLPVNWFVARTSKSIHELASHAIWHGGPNPNHIALYRSFNWALRS